MSEGPGQSVSGGDESGARGALSESEHRIKAAAHSRQRPRRRRWASDERRTHQLGLRFSTAEVNRLTHVASRLGLDTGAWCAEVLDLYARGVLDPAPADWRNVVAELLRYRSELERINHYLAAVVSHLSTHEQVEDRTACMLTATERMLVRIDALTEQASVRVSHSR